MANTQSKNVGSNMQDTSSHPSPFGFFDHIYCISLPRSEQRRQFTSAHFKELGIENKVEWIFAEPPSGDFSKTNFKKAGILGCSLSHMRAIYDSVSNMYSNCLILEDDVFFSEDYFNRMNIGLSELSDDWDILYLGGSPKDKLIPISSQLSKPKNMLGTIAYAINSEHQKRILQQYFKKITSNFPANCADNIAHSLNNKCNSYTFNPYICETHNGYSEVQNAHRTHQEYIRNLWIKARCKERGK
tara:strand:+ start:1085 stop:1816 length:732 start_codon:yes stop_codon:yes gene_type:complete